MVGFSASLNRCFGLWRSFTGKDLILIAGGVFLVYKAVQEIHANLEGVEGEATAKMYGKVATVVIQIAVINLVFWIDSIVTAVGLATEIWVMAVAVILSMMVLMRRRARSETLLNAIRPPRCWHSRFW